MSPSALFDAITRFLVSGGSLIGFQSRWIRAWRCDKIKEKSCQEDAHHCVIIQSSGSYSYSLWTCSAPCWRLVQRVPAGVGPFPQTGRPQHADALSGVVALWDCRIPDRRQSVMYKLAATAYVVTPSPQRAPRWQARSLLRPLLLALQFPIGFSVAASVRVGNAVGAGDTVRAKPTKWSLIFLYEYHKRIATTRSMSRPWSSRGLLSGWSVSFCH